LHTNAGRTVGQVNLAQFAAFKECSITNTDQTVGQFDAYKRFVFSKCLLTNTGHLFPLNNIRKHQVGFRSRILRDLHRAVVFDGVFQASRDFSCHRQHTPYARKHHTVQVRIVSL